MYHIFFIHSSGEKHLAFQVLALMEMLLSIQWNKFPCGMINHPLAIFTRVVSLIREVNQIEDHDIIPHI